MNLIGDSIYPCNKASHYKGKPAPEIIRFWSKALIGGDDCWIWLGATGPKGYGEFKPTGSRVITAHSWIATNFHKWPKRNHKTLVVDHICRNTSCVRPSHLRLVTQHENVLNGTWALKTHCPQGHPYSEDNLDKSYKASRVCKTCKYAHTRQYALARRLRQKNPGLKPATEVKPRAQ